MASVTAPATDDNRSRSVVSVIIPVFNREKLVQLSIDSVLAQSCLPDEIVVVDDGSTDKSAAFVEAMNCPRIKLIRQANGGIGAARNRGFEVARGDVIAYLDSDDLWESNKLQLQLQVLDENPSVGLVFGQIQEFFDSNFTRTGEAGQAQPSSARGSAPTPGWLASTLLARREAVETIGPYATDCAVGEFIDWFHRGESLGVQALMMSELVARRRIHPHNTVLTQSPGDYLKVLKRAIDRRRENRP